MPRDTTPVIPKRVLVVDDNPDIGECVCDIMTVLGHESRWARDGQAAIKLAAQFEPHVVFLDIGLPDLTGHDVAVALRRAADGRPLLIVALTGWGQAEDRWRSYQAGMDLHLVKPAGLDTLRGVVGEVPSSRKRLARRSSC
ncbi:MAG TPA: response regulator [Kofleriaceae bacterium]|nr:response regulator [Kofleriaceae bacterium]